MKCPHCGVMFTASWVERPLEKDRDGYWAIRSTVCDNDECKRVIVELGTMQGKLRERSMHYTFINPRPVRPRGAARPVDPSVEKPFSSEFEEAVTVLPDSPKASAALSRRCLQNLIREKEGIRERDLATEIDKLLALNKLPSWLADDVDAVRHVGNFGAHPIKSQSTGAIVDVEPNEAEWLLHVLEGLFDFYFVQPAAAQKRRAKLNLKLQDAGKPQLKTAQST
jgi:hypothetical protein